VLAMGMPRHWLHSCTGELKSLLFSLSATCCHLECMKLRHVTRFTPGSRQEGASNLFFCCHDSLRMFGPGSLLS